jgi:hypothetical protein
MVGAAVVALAFGAGCGDNGNGNGNDNGGVQPTRTATPAAQATATPTQANPQPTPTTVVGNASVVFAVSATQGVNPISASFNATYDPAKGSFAGAAGSASGCTVNTADGFVSSDNDNGTLQVALNSSAGLTLPATVTCPFEQASVITAADLTIANKVIAVLDQNQIPVAGNPDDLIIGTTVTQP